MKEHLSRDEMEMNINTLLLDDTAVLYASDPTWIHKMDKIVEKNPDQFKVTDIQYYDDGDVISKSYEFPKRFITIRTKDVKFSDEQKARIADNLKRNKNTDFEPSTLDTAGNKTD